MDEIDRLLLEILQENATLSIAQMAERVGLSPTPCWKRIQKLEGGGVITRRVAVADMAEYDAFYKRLIAIAPMKNVTSRFAMERMKHTTAYPLHPRAFRDRRVIDNGDNGDNGGEE